MGEKMEMELMRKMIRMGEKNGWVAVNIRG